MKQRAKKRAVFFIIFCLSFFMSVGGFQILNGYACDYSTTATPEDGWILCYATCQAEVEISLGCPNGLKKCRDYCANARMYSLNELLCGVDTVGNPIDLPDKSKTQTETDYTGPGEFPLEIKRYYSSKDGMLTTNFGVKWHGVFTSKIVSINTSIPHTLTVVRPSGRRIQFSWSGGATAPIKPATTQTLTFYVNNHPEIDPAIPYLWSFVSKDGWEEIYEFDLNELLATGRYESKLIWIKSPSGLKQIYTFDTAGRIETITDHAGRTLTYTYYEDGTDRIHTITVPGDRTFSYEYDGVGNLWKVYFPDDTPGNPADNPYRQYHYENVDFVNHLTGITDENGDRYATFGYNADGDAISSEHAGGASSIEVVEYAGDSDESHITVRNSAGRDSVYHYQMVGSGASAINLLIGIDGESTDNCVASNSTIAYDANYFIDYIKDGRDFYTDYTYDAQGFERAREEAMIMSGPTLIPTDDSCVTETDWTTSGQVEEVRREGITTTYTYENNRIKTRTDTDTTTHTEPYSTNGTTRTWTYTYTYYDAAETKLEKIEVDGPRTDVNDLIEHNFNQEGYLTSTVRWVDNVNYLETTFSDHNEDGLPQTIIDPNDITTTITYTPRGWLDTRTVVTSAGNVVTDYDYDDVGQVEKITLPNGVELNYEYDAAQRLWAIYTNTGERTEYILDDFGNHRTERVRNDSAEIRYLHQREFNDIGKLWKDIGVEDQEFEVYGYDANKNLETVSDVNLLNIINAYDGLNRLWRVTDRKTGVIEYTYDNLNNIIEVKDQNDLITQYDYDGFSRKIRTRSPDTGATVYYYDLADNMVRKIDNRGVETILTYDGLNRLLTVEYPTSPGENITYRYDELLTAGQPNKGLGRQTGITEANGDTIDWIYNDLGRVEKDIRTIGGASYTTEYDYDPAGILTKNIYPSGREVEYILDGMGRAETVRTRKTAVEAWVTLAENIAFEPMGGPLTDLAFGNGYVLFRGYDLHYRPDTIQTGDGTINIQNLDYDYYLTGEISAITDLLDPTRTQDYVFDAIKRLTDATGAYGTFEYSYDDVGNRETRANTGSGGFSETYTYPPDSHRLASVTSTGTGGNNYNYSYTDAGSISSNGIFNYEYNAANRMTTVRQDSTIVAEYVHNAIGQRVSKAVSGDVTHFIYDLKGRLLLKTEKTWSRALPWFSMHRT